MYSVGSQHSRTHTTDAEFFSMNWKWNNPKTNFGLAFNELENKNLCRCSTQHTSGCRRVVNFIYFFHKFLANGLTTSYNVINQPIVCNDFQLIRANYFTNKFYAFINIKKAMLNWWSGDERNVKLLRGISCRLPIAINKSRSSRLKTIID